MGMRTMSVRQITSQLCLPALEIRLGVCQWLAIYSERHTAVRDVGLEFAMGGAFTQDSAGAPCVWGLRR